MIVEVLSDADGIVYKDFVSITLGEQITDEVKRVFNRGHCHSLALALHQITGWPIVDLRYTFDHWYCGRRPFHVMVQHPDGGCVDIDGYKNDCVIETAQEIKAVKATTVRRRTGNWFRINMDLGLHYAAILVQELKRQRMIEK